MAEVGDDPAGEPEYQALALPGSLRELVARRFEALPDDALQLCRAVAVLGREAELGLASRMTTLGEAQLDEATSELLRRQVVESPAAGLVRFVHDKLREVAYERIGPEERTPLHRAAAEGIEALFAEQREEYLAELSQHWELAGDFERARPYHLAAARQAGGRYGWQDAELHYRSYLRLAAEPTRETVIARTELSWEVLRIRVPQRAIEELGETVEQAGRLGARELEAEALAYLGDLHRMTGQPNQARATLEQALVLQRRAGDRPGEAVVLGYLGTLAGEQSRLEESWLLHEQAASIYRELGDRPSEGLTLGLLAILAHEQGRIEEGRVLADQCLPILREVGDRRGEGRILANLAVLKTQLGPLEEARLLAEQALSINRQLGELRFEGWSLTNLAAVHFEQARFEEARLQLERALSIYRRVGEPRGAGDTLRRLAILDYEQGRVEAAGPLFEQALSNLRGFGDSNEEALALCGQAALERRAWGRLDRARQIAVHAESLLREGRQQVYLLLCLCERGHGSLAQRQSGQDALDEANQIAEGLGVLSDSELGKALARLQRAQQAFDAGQHDRLFRGELVEDVPEGLRRWLCETGQLVPGVAPSTATTIPEVSALHHE